MAKIIESSSKNASPQVPQSIITLNVGGKRFSTSRETLSWVPDTFFSSLISGRIPSVKDETGAIFVDRDPVLFEIILNFLRTRDVDIRNVNINALRHEAEFYGLQPLVKRLIVCAELDDSSCGSILFYTQLNPPVFDEPSLETPQTHRQIHTTIKPELQKQVIQIVGHLNCIAVAYNHCVCVLQARESRGWELVYTTPPLEKAPQCIALNARVTAVSLGDRMLAVLLGTEVKVWSCSPQPKLLTTYDMKISVDGLLFANNQLVAISNTGKVAIWQSVQKHWQVQELSPIGCYDVASSFLLLGCENGSIYYIDMEKFPVRMKDNDLLVTQMFEDPFKEPITALSIFIPPNCYDGQTWLEVAYGTRGGGVRLIVRHPENIGHTPQLFQSYNVHANPVSKVLLGEKCLISVCAENHVRTWSVTRFRGRISTQPGSKPISSFKVLSLEGAHSLFYPVNSIGPFGQGDDEQVFIQRVVPNTDTIFIRQSSSGHRICKITSVDNSNITSYCVHECESVNRVGMRSRRFVFTGHVNGSIQLWDLNTALEMYNTSDAEPVQGPTKQELLHLLKNCDLTSSSGLSTNNSFMFSRTPSPSPSLLSIMYPGYKQTSSVSRIGTPISTPILQHTATGGARQYQSSLEPSYYTDPPQEQLLPSTSARVSGLFSTGSNLSLNAAGDDGETVAGTLGDNPVSPRFNEEEQIEHDNIEKTVVSVTVHESHTMDRPDGSNEDESIPDRPFSSSEVLDCRDDFTSAEPLRRVCSDTTPPTNRQSKQRKLKRRQEPPKPLDGGNDRLLQGGNTNKSPVQDVRESTLI